MINELTISDSDANLICSRNEGQFLDFKSTEITPSKLTRTLSALANSDGGEVLVGIAENKKKTATWKGFDTVEAANAHIQVIEKLFPVGTNVAIDMLGCASRAGFVLRCEVNKTTDVKVASDGIPYIRRGAQNLPQKTAEEVRRLELNKGIHSYEDEILNVDPGEIENSAKVIEFLLEIVPRAEPEPWLRKQKVIIDDRPTVAGCLLFADEPQTALPKSGVKLYRYRTTDQQGTRETLDGTPKTIEGCLYEQIYAAVQQTLEITESIPVFGDSGLEKISYPNEAIHEVVTNALIHRDYSVNDDVHIRIFDNRIEVQSPGLLPAHVSEKNILDERFARNPKIVRLLNKFNNPPNQDVGEGLNTAFEAMRGLKLKDPIVQQRDNNVVVILRHEKLGTPEEAILEYLQHNSEINNSTARAITYIGSENTIKRIFIKMMKAGVIERIPDRPLAKTGYVKGPNFPDEDKD